MVFSDIGTWLGKVRAVFELEPFCLIRIHLPETFVQDKIAVDQDGFSAESDSSGCRRQAESLCDMIRDYFDKKKPIDPPWQWLYFKELNAGQRRVLELAARIPFGRVRTYGEIAAEMGKPRAARFVGNTMASNPYPLIIPCHRVIRSDGTVGGFGGGTDMKRRLLEHEAGMEDTVLAHRK